MWGSFSKWASLVHMFPWNFNKVSIYQKLLDIIGSA